MRSVLLLLLSFTLPQAPPRHPSLKLSDSDMEIPKLWVYDPGYGNGAAAGIPNVVGASVTCSPSQALGLYYDGGSTSVTCIDTTTVPAAANPPAAPTGTNVTTYPWAFDAGFPPVQSTIDSFWSTQMPVGLFAPLYLIGPNQNWDVQCHWTQGWGTNTVLQYRAGSAPQTVGSLNSNAFATTNLYSRSRVNTYTTSGAVNLSAGVRVQANAQNAWRGNTAGAGGFLFWIRSAMQDTAANTRWAAGIFNTTSALTATTDPNVVTDAVYFGCNAGDSNLSICSNDNSGTATCAPLGASFPCTTDGAWYDYWITAPPNAAFINWGIQRIDTGVSASGQLTADLPRNTVTLNWQTWGNTGTSTASLVLGWIGACYFANL